MDTSIFQGLLIKEKVDIERTLTSVGHKEGVGHITAWEPSFPDLNASRAEQSEVADEYEEFDNRIGVETSLARRLSDIDAALSRITNGIYGTCAVGGEQISEDRLRANPAATTCITHAPTRTG
ncbi:MAG: TraR/DksA C4-type zinc finger protein [Patescibacteria group bacterium]